MWLLWMRLCWRRRAARPSLPRTSAGRRSTSPYGGMHAPYPLKERTYQKKDGAGRQGRPQGEDSKQRETRIFSPSHGHGHVTPLYRGHVRRWARGEDRARRRETRESCRNYLSPSIARSRHPLLSFQPHTHETPRSTYPMRAFNRESGRQRTWGGKGPAFINPLVLQQSISTKRA